MNLNIYIYVGMDKPTSTARWGITSCIMENCIIQVFQRQKYRSGGSVSKVSTLISISTNDITAGDIALYAAMCWANWNSIPSATGAFNIYSWTGDDFPFLQDGLCQPPWNILKPDLQVLLSSDPELLPAPSLVPPPSPRPLVEHVRLQREGADGLYNFWAEQARI